MSYDVCTRPYSLQRHHDRRCVPLSRSLPAPSLSLSLDGISLDPVRGIPDVCSPAHPGGASRAPPRSPTLRRPTAHAAPPWLPVSHPPESPAKVCVGCPLKRARVLVCYVLIVCKFYFGDTGNGAPPHSLFGTLVRICTRHLDPNNCRPNNYMVPSAPSSLTSLLGHHIDDCEGGAREHNRRLLDGLDRLQVGERWEEVLALTGEGREEG
jgi:hypothetical protein